MESIILSQQGIKKINQNSFELYYQDLETSIKKFTPGEWCYFEDKRKGRFFLGYLNSFVENNKPCARLIKRVKNPGPIDEEKIIAELLSKAIERRKLFFENIKNTRLVYGQSDNLPGLIVDAYESKILIQINTAGIDKHRNYLLSYFQKMGEFQVIFLDNKEYRKGEMLPEFDAEDLSGILDVVENNIKYEIRAEVTQKIGFYFDHRLNRLKAKEIIKYLPGKKRCLDLFSYVGAWGLNLLSGGVAHVDFIDQGDFEIEIDKNLALNSFEARGVFHRADVFKYLRDYNREKYDVICSDPPAFCKSKKEAHRAREGYIKLHALCFKHLAKKAIFLACSCTQYVDHNEFQDTVVQAALKSGREIQLIDVGMQSYDHPITALDKKNSYLKYYAYYVE